MNLARTSSPIWKDGADEGESVAVDPVVEPAEAVELAVVPPNGNEGSNFEDDEDEGVCLVLDDEVEAVE